MNFLRKIFKKKEQSTHYIYKGSLEYALSLNLKHTVSLGILSSEFFDNGKDNYEILSISYDTGRGHGLVSVVLQRGLKVERIDMTTQEAIENGFINPYGLNKYCTL